MRPSRALPGLVWRGVWFPTMQGCSFDGIRFRRCGNCSLEVFRSRRRERGALRSPTSPRGTGCERVITLSRSPGVRLAGSLVSDGTGNCSGLEDLISDGAELFGRGFWFPTERGTVLIGGFDFQRSGGYSFDGFCFRRRRAWGAPLPYTPSGDGCERGITLSRSPGDGLEGSLVSDGARNLISDGTGAILLRAFASGDAGRGALRSPTPPRGRGARGL